MRYCSKCGAENQKDAKFCEQCGQSFTDNISESKIQQQELLANDNYLQDSSQSTSKDSQKNKAPWILSGIVLLGVVVGSVIFLTTSRSQVPEPVARTTRLTSKESSDSTDEQISKYDKLIQEAKKLTINGDYKESSLKLASIPESDLSKKELSAIRDTVQELTKQNNAGIQNEKNKDSNNDSNQFAPAQVAANNGFSGDLAKWANTFTFYYAQNNQHQASLTISANGGVTQNNQDSTQYFGKATITTASGNYLSYDTNSRYPNTMPDTKTINPDVKITIQWDSGGSQTLYGYLSYSSRLALTDGYPKYDGVNEVWISY